MSDIILNLDKFHFTHFIKCLLSNPKEFTYHTMNNQLWIKSNAEVSEVQEEIYDWLGRRRFEGEF